MSYVKKHEEMDEEGFNRHMKMFEICAEYESLKLAQDYERARMNEKTKYKVLHNSKKQVIVDNILENAKEINELKELKREEELTQENDLLNAI